MPKNLKSSQFLFCNLLSNNASDMVKHVSEKLSLCHLKRNVSINFALWQLNSPRKSGTRMYHWFFSYLQKLLIFPVLNGTDCTLSENFNNQVPSSRRLPTLTVLVINYWDNSVPDKDIDFESFMKALELS